MKTSPSPLSVTQPFGFKRYLQALKRPDYAFPFILVGLIGLGFYLRSADFLLAPGLAIDLPKLEHSEAMSLPVSKVLSVMNADMLLFEGGIYSLEDLEKLWAKCPPFEGRLLLKCDKTAELEVVLELCELAKKVGFDGVHIAANTMGLPEADFIEI